MVDLIKYFVLTEKSTLLMEDDQYTFDVDLRLSKPKIKSLIEELFDVHVLSVNTHRLPQKKRRLGQYQGSRTRYKRAIVRIKADERIPIFSQ